MTRGSKKIKLNSRPDGWVSMRSPGKVRSRREGSLHVNLPTATEPREILGSLSHEACWEREGLNSGKACHLPGGDNDCVGLLPAQLGQPLERVLG